MDVLGLILEYIVQEKLVICWFVGDGVYVFLFCLYYFCFKGVLVGWDLCYRCIICGMMVVLDGEETMYLLEF